MPVARFYLSGASGFVGREVDRILSADGNEIIRVNRERMTAIPGPADAFIHLAGRAHGGGNSVEDGLSSFRRDNVELTGRLARSAANAGVRRFVFVSSIAVHEGAFGDAGTIDESTPVAPVTPYGVSKAEAEALLWDIAARTETEVVVVRPALVAGAGAPGNLARLVRASVCGYPLPVPREENRRSFVDVEALAVLLGKCATDAAAAGRTFLAAAPEWPSTRAVMGWMAEGAGRAFLPIAIPDATLRNGARLLGRVRFYEKVFGDLVVDASVAQVTLDWQHHRSLKDVFHDMGRSRRFYRER